MGVFGDITDMAIPLFTQGDQDKVNGYARDLIDQAKLLNPDDLKSAFGGISTDPSTRMAQMKALSQLSEIANAKGLDPESKAELFDAQKEGAGFEKSQRDAALNRLQAQGMGNSGAAVQSILAAQQGGANREAMQGVHAAADSRRRAMQALAQMGDLAGGIRHEDYGEAAQRAGALDAMTRAKYQGQLGKFGALNDAYTMGTRAANQDAARTAGQISGFGNFIDDGAQTAFTAASGGFGGMPGGFGGLSGGSAPKSNYAAGYYDYNPYPTAPKKLDEE